MKTSRRSLFGWLAGAAVAAPAVSHTAIAQAPAEPGPFLGQIRAVHSHYETVPFGGAGLTSTAYTHTVAVQRYEQWNGRGWVDIGVAPLMAPSAASHSHMVIDGNHSHTFIR